MIQANESMIAKLEEMEGRYEELGGQMADPDIASKPTQLVAVTKEQGKLRGIVSLYREYKKAAAGAEEARAIIDDAGADEEFRGLAEEEIKQSEAKAAELLMTMQNKLVMADDDSIGSVIVEIRAGTGGEEAALFARDLYNMYTRYAERRRWKVEQLDFSASDMGGFREVILAIKGEGVWSELGYEGGGHRVQRVPETESQGRVHTSAATVAVLPEPEEVEVEINPNDVVEQVCRAGGPGGQNVNKVSSAIRLEHIPTGITVSMRDERSQHKNRAKAWRVLRSRIYEQLATAKRAKRDSARKSMIGSGDRSMKIRTYNFPQNRLTDHRINLSLYNLDKILMGELDEVIAALKEHEIQQRLSNL